MGNNNKKQQGSQAVRSERDKPEGSKGSKGSKGSSSEEIMQRMLDVTYMEDQLQTTVAWPQLLIDTDRNQNLSDSQKKSVEDSLRRLGIDAVEAMKQRIKELNIPGDNLKLVAHVVFKLPALDHMKCTSDHMKCTFHLYFASFTLNLYDSVAHSERVGNDTSIHSRPQPISSHSVSCD